MTKRIATSELKKAYIESAHIVARHGEKYLPIFERLKHEYENRKKESELLTVARSISKSNDIS